MIKLYVYSFYLYICVHLYIFSVTTANNAVLSCFQRAFRKIVFSLCVSPFVNQTRVVTQHKFIKLVQQCSKVRHRFALKTLSAPICGVFSSVIHCVDEHFLSGLG